MSEIHSGLYYTERAAKELRVLVYLDAMIQFKVGLVDVMVV